MILYLSIDFGEIVILLTLYRRFWGALSFFCAAVAFRLRTFAVCTWRGLCHRCFWSIWESGQRIWSRTLCICPRSSGRWKKADFWHTRAWGWSHIELLWRRFRCGRAGLCSEVRRRCSLPHPQALFAPWNFCGDKGVSFVFEIFDLPPRRFLPWSAPW